MVNTNKIRILVYSDITKYYEAMMQEFKIDKFSVIDYASDEMEYGKFLQGSRYDIILICGPRINNHFLGIPRRNFNAISKLTKIARNRSSYTIIVGYDDLRTSSLYMEHGADFFIPMYSGKFANASGAKGQFKSLYYFKHLIEKLMDGNKNPGQDMAELIIEKKEFYDSVADIFDTRAIMTADAQKEIGFLIQVLKGIRGRILDAGCGKGRIANALAQNGFLVSGVDISETLLKEAFAKSQLGKKTSIFSSQRNPAYFIMNLTELKFEASTFAAAIMMWHVICEFKEHQIEVFKEVYRVLQPGGLLIFDFPDKAPNIQINEKGEYEDEGSGLKKYRSLVMQIDEMLGLVESQGFQILMYERVHWGIDKFIIVAKKM